MILYEPAISPPSSSFGSLYRKDWNLEALGADRKPCLTSIAAPCPRLGCSPLLVPSIQNPIFSHSPFNGLLALRGCNLFCQQRLDRKFEALELMKRIWMMAWGMSPVWRNAGVDLCYPIWFEVQLEGNPSRLLKYELAACMFSLFLISERLQEGTSSNGCRWRSTWWALICLAWYVYIYLFFSFLFFFKRDTYLLIDS